MKRIVVGITGATGAVYGVRLVERLAEAGAEVHLIMSRWARVTLQQEAGYPAERVEAMASRVYSELDQSAPISSGSFRHDGMIVAPCSMKTLAAIRIGYAEKLIARAADVTIKENRKLVLMIRETPLSAIHLENMLRLSEIGVTIFPAVPAFYSHPKTIDEMIDQSVDRLLDMFDVSVPLMKRWNGLDMQSRYNDNGDH